MATEINQVIRRMEQGITQPYICGCTNGSKYVVKGSTTTKKQLAAELICALLSREFGLPTPDFSLIRVPQEIIDSGIYPGLDIDWCFGSMFIDNLTEMVFSQVNNIDRQVMLDLYIFDYWVRNPDRNLTKFGGNPNAFIDISNSSLVVFDHNLAFDTNFSIDDHKRLHLASTIWNSRQKRLDDRPKYSDRFSEVMALWPQITEEIPIDWFDNDAAKSSFLTDIKVRLLSYEDDLFWGVIK